MTGIRKAIAAIALALPALTTIGSQVPAIAQEGTWSPTGSMAVPRISHTATLLEDGRVLIVGGVEPAPPPFFSVPSRIAELFDPRSGKFRRIGSTIFDHAGGTATRLSDGRVIIVGPVSAEIYDPETASFSSAGNLIESRRAHTVTLLKDGRVLIAGGFPTVPGPDEAGILIAELFDPETGTFSQTDDLGVDRNGATASLLPNGKVLIAGGLQPSNFDAALDSAELYDPTTEEFAPTGSMDRARFSHTANLLSDGHVLIAGGDPGCPVCDSEEQFPPPLESAELYDPIAGTFAPAGSLIQRRTAHASAVLFDGRVLIAGGSIVTFGFATTDSAEIYDPETSTFVPADSMNSPRGLFTATRLLDGRVLVAGGFNGETAMASAEIFESAEAVTICHRGKRTIQASRNALAAHLRHGDFVGACPTAGLELPSMSAFSLNGPTFKAFPMSPPRSPAP